MSPRAVARLARVASRLGAVRALGWVAGHAVRGGRGRLRRRRDPAYLVLAYHRVNDAADPFFPSLPTRVFERQVRLVARTCTVLPLEELARRARAGTLPRNAVGITFDDGYRDTLTHAAPVMAKHGVPGTVFLATGCIGAAAVLWFDRLAAAVKLTGADVLELPDGEVRPLDGVEARLAALARALRILKRLPEDDGRRWLDRTLERLAVTDLRGFKELMLSWDDVHALVGLGFTVGAHTVSHPILSRVSADRARKEITGSRAMIAAACGRAPEVFAYPNGAAEDYNPVVLRLVQEAGFACAVTTRFGVNTAATPPFELRRGGPWEPDPAVFALKLAWYRMAPDA